MQYAEAQLEMEQGASIKRASWPCRIIRKPIESDMDFFVHDVNLSGAIIEYCPGKKCDCTTGIWVPEEGDKEASDWSVAIQQAITV